MVAPHLAQNERSYGNPLSSPWADQKNSHFRVEPVVTRPAPPQTRTCAINAYGSSVARASALLWPITMLPCMANQMV
jgi:hypothetical protein